MSYELKKITDFTVGQSNTFTKTITEADVLLFGGVCGDLNPIHFNEEYAATTMYGRRIVHGGIVGGLLSAAGAELTGQGSVYVKDERFFAAPVYIGDTISAKVEVADMNLEKKNMHLKATCTNQKGETVLTGRITIKFII